MIKIKEVLPLRLHPLSAGLEILPAAFRSSLFTFTSQGSVLNHRHQCTKASRVLQPAAPTVLSWVLNVQALYCELLLNPRELGISRGGSTHTLKISTCRVARLFLFPTADSPAWYRWSHVGQASGDSSQGWGHYPLRRRGIWKARGRAQSPALAASQSGKRIDLGLFGSGASN